MPDYTKSRALVGSLSRIDYQPIITSTDKMVASSRFATVSEDDFALKSFFFLFFEIINLCIYTKTIIRPRLGEYSPIIAE